MKNKKIILQYLLMTFLLLGNYSAFSQTIHKHLRYGDEHYYKKEYEESEESYRKALQKDTSSMSANYNLGNVLYQQERFNEAVNYYAEAVDNAESETQKANAYHNLGNANLAQMEMLKDKPQEQQEALKQGVEAYKNALKINPNDKATKYNLAYAQRLMKQMEQNPQQQPQDGEGEPEEQQDKEEEEEGDKEEQRPKETPKEAEKPKEKPKPKPGEMSKKEAEKLLKIMEEEERKVQAKMNKGKGKENPASKDW